MVDNPQEIVVSDTFTVARKLLCSVRPQTPDELYGYCLSILGFDIPRNARSVRMDSPFDYICHAYFEESHIRDCVVWANRGGGKTQLGAIATFLDLVFKPGIQIRILGGSLDQSSRMYGYLKTIFAQDAFCDLVSSRPNNKRIVLYNGSMVEILAQSEQSVRGQRVHKLRCDEVDLFTPEIWEAAQFVTRSGKCGDTFVRGSVECFSTMHRPFGLMDQIVRGDDSKTRNIYKWGVLEVLERCSDNRKCEDCILYSDCQGSAKRGTGFLHIDDAIQQKARSTPNSWRTEMLCERPSRSDSVYVEFDESIHVKPCPFEIGSTDISIASPNELDKIVSGNVAWFGGMDFGFRSPTVMLWACRSDVDDTLWIVDEHIASEMTIEHHLNVMRSRCWPRVSWIGIDPAGYQRHEHLGTSTAALLRQDGYQLRARRLALRAGIEAVRHRMGSATGEVRLAISPRCQGLIEALRQYHFPSQKPECGDPVKDGADHACDALRYLIINLDRPDAHLAVKRY